MSRFHWIACLSLLTALSLARPVLADLAGAEAAYRRGVLLEKQGNDRDALVEYQDALQHYSTYYYAYRQIGNCEVRLGQRAKAVEAYEQYLAADPMDANVRDYTARLKKSLSPSPATAPAQEAESQQGYFASVELSPLFLSAGDVNALVPDGSTKASAPVAMSYGIEGGWRHASGLFIKAGFFSGAAKAYSWKQDSDTTTMTIQSSLSAFYVAPGYRYQLPLSLPIAISAELRLGQAQVSGTYTSDFSGVSKSQNSFSTGVTLLQPRLQADYLLMPHLSAQLSLGFNSADLSPVSIANGNLKTTTGDDAKISYDAPLLSAGLSWAF
jgi:tetratricopeptide (TPR) repeat protein